MPRDIPKIIHCVWIGGGDITKVKSLKGIQSWLETQPDYQVWVWWDDAHLFSMHGTRAAMAVRDPKVRALYELTLDPVNQKSAVGRDIRNLRTLDKLLQGPPLDSAGFIEFRENFQKYCSTLSASMTSDPKLALSMFLIERSQAAMAPLRELAASSERVKLCNVRDHEFLPGAPGSRMEWLNRDLYDAELAYRGIFPAAASDVLRYEALYNFGGIYMDVDLQLTERLGDLSVGTDLALCAYEDSKGAPRRGHGLPFQVATQATHKGQCLYAMNNIVATHPGSGFAAILRSAIQKAYAAMRVSTSGRPVPESSEGKILRTYWENVINKSTIDLTGPNLVREVQFWLFRELARERIADAAVARLVLALRAHANLIEDQDLDVAPQLEVEAFPRFAKVWRDDDRAHESFFAWAYANTFFPMSKVNWATEDAKKSDTKLAGKKG